MKIPHSSTMQREFGVSMTPMIDVVFLLLIFFVCTASFQIAESILPSPLAFEGSTTVSPPDTREPELEQILITVLERDGVVQLTVNGQNCRSRARFSALLTKLHDVDANLPVLLDINDETSLGIAIDIYDRCRLAGFLRIQFVAEVP